MVDYFLLLIYGSFFGLQLIGVLISAHFYRQENKNKNTGPKTVSIVIPFRNEANRITPLLRSLNEQVKLDSLSLELIFVNDHSDDETEAVIAGRLELPYQLVDSDNRGKKYAIRKGVNLAVNDYVLTLDADVELPNQYFSQLAELGEADLWILPVRIKGSNGVGKLASIDFTWLQALTYVLANNGKPFLCNGANLLFKREVFLALEKSRTDYEMVSGDDLFLLDKMKQAGKNIQSSNNAHLIVQTKAPITFSELIAQRKRWSGKMSQLFSKTLILFSALLFTSIIIYLGAWIDLIAYSAPILILPIGLKYLSELILLRLQKCRNSLLEDMAVLAVHQLFFPIYLLVILIAPVSNKGRWLTKAEN